MEALGLVSAPGNVYGTHFWVDPKEELVPVIMCQTSIREMRPEFENAVMRAITK